MAASTGYCFKNSAVVGEGEHSSLNKHRSLQVICQYFFCLTVIQVDSERITAELLCKKKSTLQNEIYDKISLTIKKKED